MFESWDRGKREFSLKLKHIFGVLEDNFSFSKLYAFILFHQLKKISP